MKLANKVYDKGQQGDANRQRSTKEQGRPAPIRGREMGRVGRTQTFILFVESRSRRNYGKNTGECWYLITVCASAAAISSRAVP